MLSLQSCLTLCDPMAYGLWPARLQCPWDSSGKNTGVGCHALLQRVFMTQGSNLHLLHLLCVCTHIYTPVGLPGGLVIKNLLAMQKTQKTRVQFSVGRTHIHIYVVALVAKNSPASAGDLGDAGLIPGLERLPGGGCGNPLQYSCLENPMGRGAWRATVQRVAMSQTCLKQLSTHIYIYIFNKTK